MSKNKSLISVDYGTRKSGLAYSVEGFAFAYKTIPTKDLLEFLPKWISERKADACILGLPINIDGTESLHSQRVRKFAKELKKHIDIGLYFHDERLTTSEARLAGVEDIDAESARLILFDFLREKGYH